MTKSKIIKAIEQAGILLVYPIQNQKEPPSIWHALYPKSQMSWDWAESADERVVDLWHQRTLLSESRKVVYAKWFQGRATFFSRPVFAAMLRALESHERQLTLPEETAFSSTIRRRRQKCCASPSGSKAGRTKPASRAASPSCGAAS